MKIRTTTACLLIVLCSGIVQTASSNGQAAVNPVPPKKPRVGPAILELKVKVVNGQAVARFTNNMDEDVAIEFGKQRLVLAPGESNEVGFKKKFEKINVYTLDDEGEWREKMSTVVRDVPCEVQLLKPRQLV